MCQVREGAKLTTPTKGAPRVLPLEGLRFCSCGKGRKNPFEAHTLANILEFGRGTNGRAILFLECGAVVAEAYPHGD